MTTLSPQEDLTLSFETSDAWHALEAELDMWRQENRPATLWWRDDDARTPSARLDQLIDLSAATKTPLVLATIPEGIDTSLAGLMQNKNSVSIVQHGWSHSNHAPSTEKKCELGDHRALEYIQRDLIRGLDVLSHLFGDSFVPVLVPPWNRISAQVAENLQQFGYSGLSIFGDRQIVQPAPGFCQANTHVDLINWRGDRGFTGTNITLDRITSHLQQRRNGQIPRGQITGILTHHLMHEADLWRFLESLFKLTANHSAAQWLTARQVFKVEVDL